MHEHLSRGGGIGRRKGLKIPRGKPRTGSIPVLGTTPPRSGEFIPPPPHHSFFPSGLRVTTFAAMIHGRGWTRYRGPGGGPGR